MGRVNLDQKHLDKLRLGAMFDKVYPNNSYVPTHVVTLIGKRFGRLRVKAYAGEGAKSHHYWCCVCDCGNVVRVGGYALIGSTHSNPGVRSCGCDRPEISGRKMRDLWATLPEEARRKWIENMRSASRKGIEKVARDGRYFKYSMDCHRAAEMLGVSHERILNLSREGILRYTFRKDELWVSSQDVAALVSSQERAKKRCRAADEMLLGA